MGILCEDMVLISQPKKPGDPTVITVNCPDKTGLGCDLTRVMLLFGLSVCRGDVSTDGKWCYVVFWVMGKPCSGWDLLKNRLLQVCPSHLSTSGISYYQTENQQMRPPDVFLLKFWCSHDRKGLLHDVTRLLCELDLTIKKVKVSTTPDGRVMVLLFVTDTRELLHTKLRQKETLHFLQAVLGDVLLSCEIELAIREVSSCSQSLPFLPSSISEDFFSLDLPNKLERRSVACYSFSLAVENNLSPSHTISYGCISASREGNCEVDLFVMQADGKKIIDTAKQHALCCRLRMELLHPLRVAVTSRGPDTELLVANPVELSGRGRPHVFYDITLALKILNTGIFSVEIGRYQIRDREWELYRIRLDEGSDFQVPKDKIEESVRDVLMGWESD